MRAGFPKGDPKKDHPNEVHDARWEHLGRETPAKVEPGYATRIEELLHHRRDHEESVLRRIEGNDEETHLPSQRYAQETVEVLRMRDGWWELDADPILQKIEGDQNGDAVDTRDAEYPFCEVHSFASFNC